MLVRSWLVIILIIPTIIFFLYFTVIIILQFLPFLNDDGDDVIAMQTGF